MKKGNIQLVFRPGPKKEDKERNIAVPFAGLFDLLKKVFRAYKSGAYKTYIFFDEPKDVK